MSFHSVDLFEESPCTSSGVASQPVSQPIEEAALPSSEEYVYDTEDDKNLYCRRCQKTFKGKAWYKKHKFLHIYKDSLNKVSEEELIAIAMPLAEQVLLKMLEDDIPYQSGQTRISYIEKLSMSTHEACWPQLVCQVTNVLLPLVTETDTRLFPQKRYEDNLKQFNQWMCDDQEWDSVVTLLSQVCECEDPSLLNSVLFRFCSKFFNAFQSEYLKIMTENSDRVSASSTPLPLNNDEQQVLYYASGYILREFLMTKSKNVQSQLRKNCVSKSFIFDEHILYSESFMQIKEWFDTRNRGGLIASNEEVFNLLLKLELVVRNLRSLGAAFLCKESVVNDLFRVENNHILELWSQLTSSSMSETDSILFFEKFINKFIKFSMTAEADLNIRILDKQRKVALRTDLKRN